MNYLEKEIKKKKSLTEDENTSRCKDRSKNPIRRVQNAPEHGRVFGVQEPIRHFWSAKRHFKRAELASFGLWPNSLWVMIRHTLFNLFTKGWVLIHVLPFEAIILHLFFYTLRGTCFEALKLLIFSNPLWDLLLKLGLLGFKDNWISFFES